MFETNSEKSGVVRKIFSSEVPKGIQTVLSGADRKVCLSTKGISHGTVISRPGGYEVYRLG